MQGELKVNKYKRGISRCYPLISVRLYCLTGIKKPPRHIGAGVNCELYKLE